MLPNVAHLHMRRHAVTPTASGRKLTRRRRQVLENVRPEVRQQTEAAFQSALEAVAAFRLNGNVGTIVPVISNYNVLNAMFANPEVDHYLAQLHVLGLADTMYPNVFSEALNLFVPLFRPSWNTDSVDAILLTFMARAVHNNPSIKARFRAYHSNLQVQARFDGLRARLMSERAQVALDGTATPTIEPNTPLFMINYLHGVLSEAALTP